MPGLTRVGQLTSLPMDHSVVIPVHDASSFLAARLPLLSQYLEEHLDAYEIVAVDDGSTDRTAAIVEDLRLPRTSVLRLPRNGGKFAAIAAGVARSRGRSVLFTDADVPYNLSAIPYLCSLVLEGGHHVAVGDRTLRSSNIQEGSSPFRHLVSRSVRTYVRLLVTGGIYDTQCGIKAIDGQVARKLFPLLREHRFAGDIELIYIALRYNMAIRRVPVDLVFQAPTSVRIRDGLDLIPASYRVRSRWRRGLYESPELRALVAQDYR